MTRAASPPARAGIVAWIDRVAPWLVGLAFLLLYARTAAPSIVELFDDTLEFQVVLPTFGIAHPTGYPLFTLAGGVWSRLLPVGNWAWRTNLFSAVCAAAAVAMLFALTRRLVGSDAGQRASWGGLAAALIFGLGPVWWMQATVAEVYALHNLLAVAILLMAVDLPASSGRALDRRMTLLWLLVGLGLAHHRTTVLLLPGLAFYLLWSIPGVWRPRMVWLLWLGALLAPLLLYAYIPLRAAAGVMDLNGSYVNTWAGFWDHVLARRYTSFFAANELSRGYDAAGWLMLWVAQAGWLGTLLAVIGLGNLADPARRKGWVLVLLVLAANLAFTLAYQVGDPEVFMLPAFLCAAALAGGGVALLLAPLRRPAWIVLAGLAISLLLGWGTGRGPAVDRSGAWAAHDYAVDLAKVDFGPGSRVIGLEGEMTALKYMQQAEGLGLAATPIVANDEEMRRAAVAEGIAAGAPTYLTRELPGIATQYSFSGEGPLVRVWPRGQVSEAQPSMPTALSLLDDRLAVEGYDLARLDWAGGPVLRLTLYWRPATELDRDLKVSLRIVDAAGNVITRPDGEPATLDASPLRQVAPTSSWAAGVQVRDVYDLPAPPFPADARLLAIVYDAATLAEAGRLEIALPR